MSIFATDGQAEVQSLSDEAIYGDEERQDETQPQEGAETEEPADGSQEGNAPEESAEPETQEETAEPESAEQPGQADPRDERIRQLEAQIATANQQYAELRKLDTKVAMENGELRRQMEAAGQAVQNAPAKVLSPEDQRAFAERFLQNPAAALQEVLGDQIRQQAETAAKAMLEPIQRQEKARQVGTVVDEAMRNLESTYPQAAESKERIRLLNQLGSLSEAAGMSRDGWTNNPELFIQQAAIRLYGLPKQVDQEAINRAIEQGKASALSELQAKESGKAGLAPGNAAPQVKKTEEDDILDGIRAAGGGTGIFR